MKKKIFFARLDDLYTMLEFINSYGKSRSLSPPILEQIVLATEEALVNIITHGYPEEKKGTIEIHCEDSSLEHGIKIIIKDQGIPFNPLENVPHVLPHSPPSGIGDDLVGGYGLYLLIELMDKVEYRRIDGMNELSLMKFF